MSGIPKTALFHANIIYVKFSDEIGNCRSIQGTGFWIKTDADHYFVTNAHNLDPSMKLGKDTPFKLQSAKVELRSERPPAQAGDFRLRLKAGSIGRKGRLAYTTLK